MKNLFVSLLFFCSSVFADCSQLVAWGYPVAPNSIALCQRILSIIDLSDSANQPMESSCGKFVMVYNGEVYNFKEIALEIISAKPDFKFKTSSDSEVILEAYVLWGAKFVSKLNKTYLLFF